MSFRPAWTTPTFTSGNSRAISRSRRPYSLGCSSEVPAGKFARTQTTPSSMYGRNSNPSRGTTRNATAHGMYELLSNPEQFEWLKEDPAGRIDIAPADLDGRRVLEAHRDSTRAFNAKR